MPGGLRAGQVISLVEVTGGLGPRTDIPRLAAEMGADLTVLLPILDAAVMFGLVVVKDGDLFLTQVGLRLQETSRNKVKVLKYTFADIEPFRTAIDHAPMGGVSSQDVWQILLRDEG
jgi:hypothetical protein